MPGDISKLNQIERIVYDQLKKDGFNDIGTAAVMGVCGGESAYKDFKEDSYYSTEANRIIAVFGSTFGDKQNINSYRGGKDKGRVDKINPSPEQIKFDTFFFDKVYGNNGVGEYRTQANEGYKYYGRGFNGLTFKANYKKYGDLIGVNLLKEPTLMENPYIVEKYGFSVPAKVLVYYFEVCKNMTDLEQAFRQAYRYNAGPGETFDHYRASKNGAHVGGIPAKRGRARYYYKIITGQDPPPLAESENATTYAPAPSRTSSGSSGGSGGGGGSTGQGTTTGGGGGGGGAVTRSATRRRTSTDSSSPEVRNIVPAKIKAKKISFKVPSDPVAKREIATNFGKTPVLWYNSYQIRMEDITYLCLYNEGSLPALKVTFLDSLNLMKDTGFPLDDTLISVFINTLSDQLKSIHMDFKITKFSNNAGEYSISGLLNVSDLYVKKYKSIQNSTSFKALQTIAEEIGMGYNSNIDDSDDSMTWINFGSRMFEFINQISDRAYKGDDAFFISFIDYFYNINLLNLEKEIKRDIKKELGIQKIGLEEAAKIDKKENIAKILLSNDQSFRTTSSFVESYKIINNSTTVSLREGYMTNVKYYDPIKKEFNIFGVDSLTTNEDKIIMKGSPQDEGFFNNNLNLVYVGKLDTDNMHANYHYAFTQNKRNIVELQKVGVELTMGNPNYNLKRFQKIIFMLSNQASTPSTSQINNRLSGEWLIIDIIYRLENGVFRQIVKIVKRELELSNEELKKERKQLKRSDTGGKTFENNPDPNATSVNGTVSTAADATSQGSNLSMVAGSNRLFFVGGLDEGSYKNLDIQTELVRQGWKEAEITSWRHKTITNAGRDMKGPSLYDLILKYPDTPILLFSQGCQYCDVLAKFMKEKKLNLANLYINEPYTAASSQLTATNDAVSRGVPIQNVFVGTYPGVGSNVPGATTKLGVKASGMDAHWQSLTAAAQYLKNRYSRKIVTNPTPIVANNQNPAQQQSPTQQGSTQQSPTQQGSTQQSPTQQGSTQQNLAQGSTQQSSTQQGSTQQNLAQGSTQQSSTQQGPIQGPVQQNEKNSNWTPGKVVVRGNFNQTGLSVTWEVKKDSSPGYYEVFIDGVSDFTTDDLSYAQRVAKEDALDLFKQRGGV